jgi:mono/diheme cytochrome c family protein
VKPLVILVLLLAATSLAPAAPRAERDPAPAPAGTLTFNKDVAPVLFDNCVSCHRPGEVAPFSLTTYADVKRRSKQIADVTGRRYMPPWKADEGAGVFHGARQLTDRQIGMIRQWVEAGAPEGDAKDLPPLPTFTEGWQLGEPDAVFDPGEDFGIPADGPDIYRCFVLPTQFGKDRYVSAMEVRPGNRKVVHHVMGYVDTDRAARALDAAASGPGYNSFGGVGFAPAGTLEGWGPGISPARLPEGVGMLVPKDADLVVQLHYHPTGKPEKDRTRIGLYFCNGPVDKRLHMAVALNPGLEIPAGAAGHEERATLKIPADVTLVRIAPHTHLIGKDISVDAVLPDGARKKLVRVPEWDFRWQTVFTFNEPVKLPKGSRVEVVAHYDNSAANPANPSKPPRDVRWGEATTDEMCVAALFYTTDAEKLTEGKAVAAFAPPPGSGGRGAGGGNSQERMAMQIFDKNSDGRLDADERKQAILFIEKVRGKLRNADRAGAEAFLEKIGGPLTRPSDSDAPPAK